MPWIKNEHGDDTYVVSKFSKDELPTWYEIHEEFYKQKWYYYDKNDKSQQTLDPYFKRPHREVVLEFMMNQLNKMFTEDEYDKFVLDYISKEYNDEFQDVKVSIIESDIKYLRFTLISDSQNIIVNYNDELFEEIIKIFLKDVIEYYKEPIGFKDKDGFLIEGYNDPKLRKDMIDTAL